MVVPLPKTWKLLNRVQCPSCGGDWHWVKNADVDLTNEGYCPNQACEQYRYLYRVRLGLSGSEVIEVMKEPVTVFEGRRSDG